MNIEKRRALTIPASLHEKSTGLLRNVEAQKIDFKSSWTKWIFLNKEEYSKVEEDYKNAIDNIKEALYFANKTVEENDPAAFKNLESIGIDIECNLDPTPLLDTTSGFITRIFEILPVITMTILPSLVQAGFLSLNVFIIASSALIGAISFLIKSRNVIQNTVENVKKEDAWFLRQVYSELIYFLRVFSKIYTKKIKYESESKSYDGSHSESREILFCNSAVKKKSPFFLRNKNTRFKTHAVLLRKYATKNKIRISYQKNTFQVYA